MADCFLTDSKCRTVKMKSQDNFSTHLSRVLTVRCKCSIYQYLRNSKIFVKCNYDSGKYLVYTSKKLSVVTDFSLIKVISSHSFSFS